LARWLGPDAILRAGPDAKLMALLSRTPSREGSWPPLLGKCHDCRTSAGTAIRHHKHLVFGALPSASCCLTVGARDAYRAFTGRGASRSRRTLLALRAGRSWWARRSRRTGLALFTRRPCRPGPPPEDPVRSRLWKWKAQLQPRYFSPAYAYLLHFKRAPSSFPIYIRHAISSQFNPTRKSHTHALPQVLSTLCSAKMAGTRSDGLPATHRRYRS
jgi:hypothetical protein